MVVDANGNAVGQLGRNDNVTSIIQQISGIWVEIPVDVANGFVPTKEFFNEANYFWQSADCTGQAYLAQRGGGSGTSSFLSQAVIAAISPATQPSIYFAGSPMLLTMQSYKSFLLNNACQAIQTTIYVGLPQNVSVSGLGLTPPFSIKRNAFDSDRSALSICLAAVVRLSSAALVTSGTSPRHENDVPSCICTGPPRISGPSHSGVETGCQGTHSIRGTDDGVESVLARLALHAAISV
jgi:hypothetical protein